MTVLKLPVTVAIDSTTLYDKEDAKLTSCLHPGLVCRLYRSAGFSALTFTTDGSENHMGYTNKTVDEICAKADYMPEKSPERLALYARRKTSSFRIRGVPLSFTREWDLINPRVTASRSRCSTTPGSIPSSFVNWVHRLVS